MNVAMAIVNAAIERLWDGANEDDKYTCCEQQLERYACHAVIKSAMPILNLDYADAAEHPTTWAITQRINTYIDGYFTAESYLRDKDENFDETTAYAQAFRKQMLLDIRKELA